MNPPVRPPDVSLVVTAHAEGLLLHRALRSVERGVLDAAGAGVATEVVMIVDRPDASTTEYLDRWPWAGWGRYVVDVGDPGLARNEGVSRSRGRYVSFLDGDDLLARSWIRRAFQHAAANSGGERAVYHPEMVIDFGSTVVLARHESSTAERFDASELAELNLWRVHVLAPRDFLLATPFAAAPNVSGFHEDWHWSCEILASGGSFVVVPGTCGFYRRRDESMMTLRRHGLFMPTRLFQPGARARPGGGPAVAPATPPGRSGDWTSTVRQRVEAAGRRVVLRAPKTLPVARAARAVLRRADARAVEHAIPPWLRTELGSIHEVEPALFADRSVAGGIRYLARARSSLGRVLTRMLADTPHDATHAILVPWLKRGGSDLEALNYATALLELGQRVVVVATEDTDSPWAGRLPAGVTFIDLGPQLRPLDPQQRERLLTVYLLQGRFGRIHNLNSRLGFDVFSKYGSALTAYCSLYVSTFCEDILPSGRVSGHVVSAVPSCEPWLRQIFADNARVLAMLGDTFGVGRDRLQVHYQPVRAGAPPTRPERPLLHVLWAGRLDRQKRPDLLLQVVEGCRGLPIRFFVYGYGLLDPVVPAHAFEGPGVEFRGAYDEFGRLPVQDFDVFVNTSQWDGLPNVILEAMVAGMTVVSSDAGGIGELVRHEETGLLVAPFDDVGGYVSSLERLLHDREERRRLADAALDLVRDRHSWEAFKQCLLGAEGYVDVAP